MSRSEQGRPAAEAEADVALAETHVSGAMPVVARPAAQAMAVTVTVNAAPGPAEAMTVEAPRSALPSSLAPSAVDAHLSEPLSSEGPRYREGELIGRGGMGEVRAHRDARIGRQVALKTLRGGLSERALLRFVREARVQGQLEHPSIVPVYDLGVDDEGRPFFTMKRIHGETLAHILGRLAAGDTDYADRFSRHRLLSAFARICLTVEYAHARGVVHRDLKPQNIMLGEFGEAYVLDWGVAKLSSGAEIDEPRVAAPLDQVTREGEIVGTPLYMAPEQLMGKQSLVGPKSDVYALGAMLFEILTLEPLRRSESVVQIVKSLEQAERPSSRRRPGRAPVPPVLDELCFRALAPSVDSRLGSVKELAEGIERFLDGDRDAEARKAEASRLIASARATIARHEVTDAEARVEAMREALRAMALSPDDLEAQRLLLELAVDGSGTLPEAAERELAQRDVLDREQGARTGRLAFVSWLGLVPLAIWIGVKSWTMIALQLGLTLLCIAGSSLVIRFRWGLGSPAAGLTLAALSGLAVIGMSSWLGPFVVVPAAASGLGVFFVVHGSRAEARLQTALWVALGLVPFALEGLGVFPPAYSFAGGELVLHPRALELSRVPTTAALVYISATFTLTLCVMVGRLREKQRAGERRLFVQAWHMRQLFPAAALGADDAPPTARAQGEGSLQQRKPRS